MIFDGREDSVHRPQIFDVTGEHEVGAERGSERLYTFAERLSLIRECERGAMRRKPLRDAPGNRVIIGDAHDQPALALHQLLHPRLLAPGRGGGSGEGQSRALSSLSFGSLARSTTRVQYRVGTIHGCRNGGVTRPDA